MLRVVSPFEILAKYGDNAFKIDVLERYGVQSTFNIGDLAPYHEDQELRSILFEGGVEPRGTSPRKSEGIVAKECATLQTLSHKTESLPKPNIKTSALDMVRPTAKKYFEKDESASNQGSYTHGPKIMGLRNMITIWLETRV